MAAVDFNSLESSGRGRFLGLLRKRVEGLKKGSKQNVALLGKAHSGKTSLLLGFYRELLGDPGVVPVYLELREEPYQLLEKKFVDSVRYSLGACAGDASGGGSPELLECMANLTRPARKTQEQVLKAVFDLLAVLSRETGRKVVFILDEFQNLAWFRIKGPFAMLGEKIMTQREVMYVISSSTVRRAQDILDNELSMLFGNFEAHRLPPPAVEESALFLKRLVPGLELSRELLDFMLYITDRDPAHIRNMAPEIHGAAMMAGTSEPAPEIVCEAAAEQLCNPSSATCRRMMSEVESALEARSVKDIEILLSIAGGSKKTPLIARDISKSASQTVKRLEKFVSSDILLKFGQVYDYSDTLMKLWVRLFYGPMCCDFRPDEKEAKLEARGRLMELWDLFVSRARLGVPERLRGLFELFENDLIEFAGRTLRFPRFNSVSGIETGEGEIPVFASAGKRKFWVADYATETVSEARVMEFLDKLSHAPKTATRIFLCCNGIDTDAKLLAKESEIWLWTVSDLNVLCGIFEQPKFIV